MRLSDSSQLATLIRQRRAAFVTALTVLALAAWVAAGASAWYVYATVRGLPGDEAVRAAGSMPRATTIADAKGRHAFTIFEEQRLEVPLSRVSPQLRAAILAIEDRRFYAHSGVDVIRIAGAAAHNLVSGRAEQGGSTITQQLARLSFLTHDRTIRRKLQELILATRLERTYTKDEILELYLNKAYFGDGLYGVEAASLGFFGVHASDLTVPQAALIAGLVKSPSTYAPTVGPERALARRNVVLGAMREVGAIDERTYRAAVASPLRLNDALRREEAYGQYFKEEVRKELVERFGWERVYHGGLRVETTIDLDLQKAAEAEVARALADIERRQQQRRRQSTPADEAVQAALVALDPRTGEVRAMVGGRDFAQSRFNRVTQSRRQPGSAFKPFVYAAALERGFTPATLITGLSEPVLTFRGAWLPEDEHLEHDGLTMRAALRTSSNRAAVRMLQTIGVDAAVDYAEQLGLGGMPRVPSVALGSGEVTLLSLTAAFGAFANEGQLAAPGSITRVTTPDGEVLYERTVETRPAVNPATAFLMNSMLRDVIDAGTAAQARALGFRLPAAGKTGTTNDYRDAWFVGYTPALVTGVWVGYDQPRTIVNGGYAAQLAVPLWARFMAAATRGDEPTWFDAPAGITAVEVDRITGRRASDACRGTGAVYTEYFAEGTAPLEMCPLHRSDVLQALAASPGAPAQTPPQVAVAATAPQASEPAVDAVEPAPPPTPAKKKRGFWARVFGVVDDEDDTDKK